MPSVPGVMSMPDLISGYDSTMSPSSLLRSERQEKYRVVVVLAASVRTGRQVLAELSVLYRFGCCLDVVASPEMRASRGLAAKCRFYSALEDMPDSFLDGVDCIVAVLNRGSAAKICLGLQDDMGSQVFLEGLWRGIEVYADLSGLVAPPTGNEALRALYEGYAESIDRLGVYGIERGNYVTVLLERFRKQLRRASAPVPAEDVVPVPERRFVVTGKDVREHAAGGEWRLPYGTIVTDVARETAERMGIELIVCSGEGVPRHADS